MPGQLQEAVSCPNEGHLRGYEVFLTHGIADFQRDTMSGIVSACPANGAFLNQTQLFVLTTQASQGIEFHGSIRKAVICPTKIAGAKLCLQLLMAIKNRHPLKAGCNRSVATQQMWESFLPQLSPWGISAARSLFACRKEKNNFPHPLWDDCFCGL